MSTLVTWLRRQMADPQIVVLSLIVLALGLGVWMLGRMLAPLQGSLVIAYLLGGGGWNVKNRQLGCDNTNSHLNAVFGFLTDIVRDGSVALRTELRYRFDGQSPSAKDLILNISVQIPLGTPYAAPVAMAAAAPPPPADSDGDGVPDSIDRCPNTPAGARVDAYGCSCYHTLSLNFAFSSAELTAEDKAALDELIAVLRNLPQVRGVIEGHTDSRGPEAYNQQLSERRANAVRDYLHNAGIGDNQFTAVGLGESSPIASNDTDRSGGLTTGRSNGLLADFYRVAAMGSCACRAAWPAPPDRLLV